MKSTAIQKLLLADEVWLVVARMHQCYPDRESFAAADIVSEVRKANLFGQFRAGVVPHVHLHLIANMAPNPAAYRMLFKLANGDLRLYRPGDPTHPDRRGKTMPDRDRLPAIYHHDLDWYEQVYCSGRAATVPPPARSFIDRLSGLGKLMWSDTSADDYVLEQRKGWDQ